MDNIAYWMGYIKAMNYTGKIAYFRRLPDNTLLFVSNIKDYDPRLKKDQFVPVIERAIDKGAEITVKRIKKATMKYMNVTCIMTIDSSIYTETAIDYQRAVIKALTRYLNDNYKTKKK